MAAAAASPSITDCDIVAPNRTVGLGELSEPIMSMCTTARIFVRDAGVSLATKRLLPNNPSSSPPNITSLRSCRPW